MQPTLRKTVSKTKLDKTDEPQTTSRKVPDEKLKRTSYGDSTPRNYVQKSLTTDIYGQAKKNVVPTAKTPKKLPGTSRISNVSPMRDVLKSSPSSVSVKSFRSINEKRTPAKAPLNSARSIPDKKVFPQRIEAKASIDSAKRSETPRTAKDLPFTNVTVNSPTAKRKLHLDVAPDKKGNKTKTEHKESSAKSSHKVRTKDTVVVREGTKETLVPRERTKTRTLQESEVKVLTAKVPPENNGDMWNFSDRLVAKPKAFYVDLDPEPKTTPKNKSSDEEYSYEDDFESYESDFESYHSDETKPGSENESSNPEEETSKSNEETGCVVKDKDEEKMMDSGNFDLRESQRSANRKPALMANIVEDSEDAGDEKKASLTDEGFQEMSSASAVSSLKTAPDGLDRPLFINFSKSKENRRKRRLNEQFMQRAKDLLGMITLHEMPYSLFDMKPIPYDLYMATFGRTNYTQIAVQTYDDGITEEVQTEEVLFDCKWTQHPVEFSNKDIFLKTDKTSKRFGNRDEDYLKKFTFLINRNRQVNSNKINTDKDYENNQLRIFLEQKDGVGSSEMLPYEKYISKVKDNEYNANKLRKFLKKVENRVLNVLNKNAGESEMTDFIRPSNQPFSKGFSSISISNVPEERFSFLKNIEITGLVCSEDKNNIILTIHKKSSVGEAAEKCVLCLWDVNVARKDPVKILVAIDNVNLGRLKGSTDGIFVAALQDSSIHLWDLSEEPTWRNDVASDEKSTKIVEIDSKQMTQIELDREWNLKNSHIGCGASTLQFALQACAYTSSAANLTVDDVSDEAVGLEFVGNARVFGQDGGRKFIGQICSLNRSGNLTIWSIIQERSKSATQDLGKAFWSKLKLEKNQTIFLADFLDFPTKDVAENLGKNNFNLNAAKRRLSNRKLERTLLKKENSRPKSAVSSEVDYDIDRPASAASVKKVLPAKKYVPQSWESGIVCCDLKIMNLEKVDNYLVAKNCGEVLCCTRIAGTVKITRFCVSTDTSSVTCLEASPHGLPYFLAATDSGTINLCSLVDARVLLTLDCRNGPPPETVERCQSDHKGRYTGSALVRSPTHSYGGETRTADKISISSIHWSHTNPCCIHTVAKNPSDKLCSIAVWDLTHSDICAKSVSVGVAKVVARSSNSLALLTPEGEVQVHRLSTQPRSNNYLQVFQKYVTLL